MTLRDHMTLGGHLILGHVTTYSQLYVFFIDHCVWDVSDDILRSSPMCRVCVCPTDTEEEKHSIQCSRLYTTARGEPPLLEVL